VGETEQRTWASVCVGRTRSAWERGTYERVVRGGSRRLGLCRCGWESESTGTAGEDQTDLVAREAQRLVGWEALLIN
jgi:hypothetical protein